MEWEEQAELLCESALIADDSAAIRAFDEALAAGATLGNADMMLYWAAGRPTTAFMDYVLAKGASLDSEHDLLGATAMHRAAELNNLDMIRCLLGAGGGPLLHRLDESCGRTPLGFAVAEGHEEAARLLLEAGSDPNLHRDPFHDAPLLDAVNEVRPGLVRLLLAFGANPDEVGWMGETPRIAATKLRDRCPEIYGLFSPK